MPVGVARINQPFASSRTGREQAETVSGEIPDQLVAGLRQQRKRPDEGFRIVVGRPSAADRLLVQEPLLGQNRRFQPIAAHPVAVAAGEVDATNFDLGQVWPLHQVDPVGALAGVAEHGQRKASGAQHTERLAW